MQWGTGSPLASATTFIHKLCLTEVDLIERMARLYNGTTAIHKLALHETQDPRDSGSAVPAFHWCVRESRRLWGREKREAVMVLHILIIRYLRQWLIKNTAALMHCVTLAEHFIRKVSYFSNIASNDIVVTRVTYQYWIQFCFHPKLLMVADFYTVPSDFTDGTVLLLNGDWQTAYRFTSLRSAGIRFCSTSVRFNSQFVQICNLHICTSSHLSCQLGRFLKSAELILSCMKNI